MYTNYNSSQTIAYKTGYIFSAYHGDTQVVKCQVDKHAYVVYVKSVQAAKLLITKHIKKYQVVKS